VNGDVYYEKKKLEKMEDGEYLSWQ